MFQPIEPTNNLSRPAAVEGIRQPGESRSEEARKGFTRELRKSLSEKEEEVEPDEHDEKKDEIIINDDEQRKRDNEQNQENKEDEKKSEVEKNKAPAASSRLKGENIDLLA